MQRLVMPGVYGGEVELDVCYGCHGFWFDRLENLKLAPAAIVELFKTLHHHRDAPRLPLAAQLACPTCEAGLVQGFDVVRSGRFITHRCPRQHGRFSSFAAFMIEKGFVRQLTRPEITELAARVGAIHCSSCGAPVDLRREDACSHCRSPLSLLDPRAVEQALQRLSATPAPAASAPAVADALVAMARQQARQAREDVAARAAGQTGAIVTVDLLSVGLSLVSSLWDD